MSSIPAGRWAARSRRTSCGSTSRFGSGATSGRRPASSSTRRKARRSTRPTPIDRPYMHEWYESKAHAGHMAGVGAQQVQFLRRSAARLPLPGECGERIDRTRRKRSSAIKPHAGRTVSGDLELPDDEQAAVRGGRGAGGRQLADLLGADLQRASPPTLRSRTRRSACTYNAPMHDHTTPIKDVPRWSQRASMSYVTGTHAFKTGFQLEELVQDISTDRHAGKRELHVQQPGADADHPVAPHRISSGPTTRISGSTRRISGRSNA